MMSERHNQIYFIVGTRAQFIKIAPIMHEMAECGLDYKLIYTAQHRENIKEIIDLYQLRKPDKILYDGQEANTRQSFLRWFLKMLWLSLISAKIFLPERGIVITHGDTFTAWLAALMGQRAGCKVAHVESGCRSFNLFNPFPEEISRIITFNLTDIFFCADEWALSNVKKYKGIKINTHGNTMLDGVRFALDHPRKKEFSFQKSSYILVSIHRYENIFTKRLTEFILPTLKIISETKVLVFTMHPTTRERLKALGKYNELFEDKNIILHDRFNFVDWINVCQKSDFVISDGGSNQEELSYLGVPTLLFRDKTERQEGLGRNVVLSRYDPLVISEFLHDTEYYRKDPLLENGSPSKLIVEKIMDLKL